MRLHYHLKQVAAQGALCRSHHQSVAFMPASPSLQALVDLQGRFFAGREVEASFFEEERFAKRELAPLASEVRQSGAA